MNVLKMKSPTTAQVVINSFKLQCLKNAQVCLSLGCRAQVFLSLGCGTVALMVLFFLFLCHSLWLQI
jgi:hypothetical protein